MAAANLLTAAQWSNLGFNILLADAGYTTIGIFMALVVNYWAGYLFWTGFAFPSFVTGIWYNQGIAAITNITADPAIFLDWTTLTALTLFTMAIVATPFVFIWNFFTWPFMLLQLPGSLFWWLFAFMPLVLFQSIWMVAPELNML